MAQAMLWALAASFHSRRYIDCPAINADGPLGVALLANHDLAAVDPDAEAGHDTELSLVLALLSPDRSKDCVDRPQDPVSSDRLVPVPQRDQPVTFV